MTWSRGTSDQERPALESVALGFRAVEDLCEFGSKALTLQARVCSVPARGLKAKTFAELDEIFLKLL
jgi:hypothetical protein